MEYKNYTRDRYVAMLDIMGFKKLIETTGENEIYTLFDKVYEEAKILSDFSKLDISFFSDTIILISKDDSLQCYSDIVQSSALFVNLFIKEGYAINGAISFGEVTFNLTKEICFGKPIIEAHLLQEELFFYGIVIVNSAINHRKKQNKYAPHEIDFITGRPDVDIKLSIPLKKEGLVEMYYVNWCEYYFPVNACYQDQIVEAKKHIENFYKKEIDDRVYNYIKNTETVLAQWFNYVGEKNGFQGWGQMLSEKYLSPSQIKERKSFLEAYL